MAVSPHSLEALDDTVVAQTMAGLGVTSAASPDARLSGARAARSTAISLPSLQVVSEAASLPSGAAHALRTLGVLGEGGMGKVWLAHDAALDREIAVKQVRSEVQDARSLDALLREARITARLAHPNVVPIHAVGLDETVGPVVVMKRIEGRTWADVLAAEATRASTRHLEIFVQVCNAVHYAHDRGIIHRDLKTDNVMLGDFGEIYVLDWGVARRLDDPNRAHEVVGTPCYMAPEMVLGDPAAIDARTDVYLLGTVLHEILTGQRRHPGATVVEVLKQALRSEPYRYDSAPRELAEICNRACARDPDDRHPTAAALRDAITAYLEQRSARALAAIARQRLAQMERLMTAEPLDERAIYAAFDEARFGFEQALRACDERDIRNELEQALRAMFDFEIQRRNESGAARALHQLGDDPDRARVLERLRDEIAGAQSRLRALERDRDPSIGRRHRALLGVALFVVAVGLVSYVSRLDLRAPDVTPWALVPLSLTIFVVIGALLVVFRSTLMGSSFNQRIALAGMLCTVGLTLNRVAQGVLGSSIDATLTSDLVITGSLLITTAFESKGLAAIGLAALLLAPVCALAPSITVPAFSALTIAIPVVMYLLWRPEPD